MKSFKHDHAVRQCNITLLDSTADMSKVTDFNLIDYDYVERHTIADMNSNDVFTEEW